MYERKTLSMDRTREDKRSDIPLDSNLNKNITTDLCDLATCLSKAKCYSNKVVTVKVYFTIITNLILKELL